MDEQEFRDLISDWTSKICWLFFKGGKCDLIGKKEARSSVAYLAFTDPSAILDFCQSFRSLAQFEGCPEEGKPQVEFAPNQNFPLTEQKFDQQQESGALETDPFYLEYLESCQPKESPVPITLASIISKSEKNTTTPLIEFINKKAASIPQLGKTNIAKKEPMEVSQPTKVVKIQKNPAPKKKQTPLTAEEIAKVTWIPQKQQSKNKAAGISNSKDKSTEYTNFQPNLDRKEQNAPTSKTPEIPPQPKNKPHQAKASDKSTSASAKSKQANFPLKNPTPIPASTNLHNSTLSLSAQEFLSKTNLSNSAQEFASSLQASHSKLTPKPATQPRKKPTKGESTSIKDFKIA